MHSDDGDNHDLRSCMESTYVVRRFTFASLIPICQFDSDRLSLVLAFFKQSPGVFCDSLGLCARPATSR